VPLRRDRRGVQPVEKIQHVHRKVGRVAADLLGPMLGEQQPYQRQVIVLVQSAGRPPR